MTTRRSFFKRLADSAIPIGRDQFYAQGWILVIRKSVIRTCYRPKTPAQLAAVHEAVQKNQKNRKQ